MNVLHATWVDPEWIHIWGEGDGRRPARLRRHPFALEPVALRAALASLLPGVPAFAEVIRALPEALEAMDLPGGSRGPAPSRPDSGERLGRDAARLKLARWKVPGLRVPMGSAVGWLVALPPRGEEPAGVTVGADLNWFAETSKLVLELVARERYVATAFWREKHGFQARWEPLFTAPGMADRFDGLVRAMPEACRAIPPSVGHRAAASFRPTRAAMVSGVLRAGVDGLVRGVHRAGETGGAESVAVLSPAGRWLAALGRPEPVEGLAALGSPERSEELEAPRPSTPARNPPTDGSAVFAAAVNRWTTPVLTPARDRGFRTGFRLESPVAAAPQRWTLRFDLHPVAGSEAPVPAAALWPPPPQSSSYGRGRVDQQPLLAPPDLALVQECLRADLARTGRLFPPVAEALQSRQPAYVWLNVDEAHQFLTDIAPLLAEGGVPVVIPPWWGARGTRLATSGVIRPLVASSGAAGLDALVHLDLKLALGGAELSDAELVRLVSLKAPLVQIRGQWVEFRPEDVEAARVLLDRRRTSLTLGEALGRGLGGEAPGRLAVLDIESEGWIRQLLDSLKGAQRLEPVPLPAAFHGALRPYQARGLAWLDFFRRHGLHACLADDMGLGKTVQTLALLRRHADPAIAGPSLLVCPTSVIGTWTREAARFAPTLKLLVHDGPGRRQGRHFQNAAARSDLVVTSYALLLRDRELLGSVRWDTAVLDEIQNIKNPAAKQAKAACALQARHRIGLTGTPVENHLTELWSIFEFLSPGYLGTLEGFRRTLATPVERWHSATHAERLRRLVTPFILRRRKTDPGIAPELPAKIETRESCRLTREQGQLYAGILKDMTKKIEQARGIQRKGLVLATLTRLKQVCDHPALLSKQRGIVAGRSGKLSRLEEILEEVVEEGQRALVFTQYAQMGALLTRRLGERLPAEILFLHGGTPRKSREAMIERFQDLKSKAAILVLSLKAGGTGLTLTAASHVVHFDRWWNPAVEAQATDRAHRIGQTKTVHVHTLVCQGTLEERIDALIESKKKLTMTIVGTGEGWITELSNTQLAALFSLGADALAEDA